MANHLQLNGFDVRTRPLLDRAVRLLHADPAQIGDKLFGCLLRELNPAFAGGPLDCLNRRLAAQELEAEGRGQPRWDQRQKWIEPGEVILSEGEQGPPL